MNPCVGDYVGRDAHNEGHGHIGIVPWLGRKARTKAAPDHECDWFGRFTCRICGARRTEQ